MSSLFEISGKFKEMLAVQESYEDDDDTSLQEALNTTLESIGLSFNDKVIDCVKYIKNLEAQSDAIKKASDDMLKRRAHLDKRVASFKAYVLNNMQATQIKQVECEYFKVSLKKNPTSVRVIDESIVPEQFMRVKEVIEVDKVAIKQAGGCNGVELVQTESLRIT